MLRDHPIIPYIRLLTKPSHETAIYGNVPQSAIFCQVIEFC